MATSRRLLLFARDAADAKAAAAVTNALPEGVATLTCTLAQIAAGAREQAGRRRRTGNSRISCLRGPLPGLQLGQELFKHPIDRLGDFVIWGSRRRACWSTRSHR